MYRYIYFQEIRGSFKHILGVKPTGWTHSTGIPCFYMMDIIILRVYERITSHYVCYGQCCGSLVQKHGFCNVSNHLFDYKRRFMIYLENIDNTMLIAYGSFHVAGFWLAAGMRIRSDPLIFGLPDPLLFLSDPDPTCNNVYIKLISSWTKYKPESTNSSLKLWFLKSIFMPTYLKYKYFFFLELRPDPDPRENGTKTNCCCIHNTSFDTIWYIGTGF